MWYFHFQIRPSLSLDDSSVSLPCQVLWEAASAIEWQQLQSCSSSTYRPLTILSRHSSPPSASPTLHTTLQKLYTQKHLQSSTGEFSRILLIHGLFRRTWEVETYLLQTLITWTPTAEKQTPKNHLLTEAGTESESPTWLPEMQLHTNWRNSACDCLDILH